MRFDTAPRTLFIFSSFVCGLACLQSGGLVAAPRQHATLQTFKSESLDARGTRVSFAYPIDWKIEAETNRSQIQQNVRSVGAMYSVVPASGLGRVSVVISPAIPRKKPRLYDGKTHTFDHISRSNVGTHLAQRGFLSSDGKYWVMITYHRNEAAAFNPTAKNICESLKVVK